MDGPKGMIYKFLNHEMRERQVNKMSDFSTEVKKIFLAGIGAIAVSAEKSAEIVDGLVKKGELTVEQGKILNEELKRDVSDKVKKAASNIQGNEPVERIAGRINEMTPEERELLRQKLDEAENSQTPEQADTVEIPISDEDEDA